MERRPNVLSIGQCSADHGLISGYFSRKLGARVVGVDGVDEAQGANASEAIDLILVNRIGDADGASGLDAIRTLKATPGLAEIPVMLVSNYVEAQEKAVALGALPGFGKGELGAEATLERLRASLSR